MRIIQEFIIKGQVEEKIEELKNFIENAPKENEVQMIVNTSADVKLSEVSTEITKISQLFDKDRPTNFNVNSDKDLGKKEIIITIRI